MENQMCRQTSPTHPKIGKQTDGNQSDASESGHVCCFLRRRRRVNDEATCRSVAINVSLAPHTHLPCVHRETDIKHWMRNKNHV